MKEPRSLAFSLLLLFAFLAACTRVSREDKISANDDASFDAWMTSHQAVLTADEVRELGEARQQIRYKVMQDHPGMMSDVFSQTVYADINGKTVRELLLLSYAYQIDRVKVDLANYKALVEKYQKYRAAPRLTDTQRQDLDNNLAQLAKHQAERNTELARVTARLEELKQGAAAK